MMVKFYNEVVYEDSFIGMVRLADKVFPFQGHPVPQEAQSASNLIFLLADEAGKVLDYTANAKNLLGVRTLPPPGSSDSFNMRHIHSIYNPSELFSGVEE